MTILNPGVASVALRSAKAPGLSGEGPTVIVSVGPITGGAPPYSVDFSHLETFEADGTYRKAAHSHNAAVFDSISFAGDGLGEGGFAFATGKLRDFAGDGDFLYFPPSCYIAVTDSAGQSVDVRLAQGGLQLTTIQE
jgi:hypothetical protein